MKYYNASGKDFIKFSELIQKRIKRSEWALFENIYSALSKKNEDDNKPK